MSYTIRVMPQYNSVGARRNRAMHQQELIQARMTRMQNLQLQRQLGAFTPGGNAYGAYGGNYVGQYASPYSSYASPYAGAYSSYASPYSSYSSAYSNPLAGCFPTQTAYSQGVNCGYGAGFGYGSVANTGYVNPYQYGVAPAYTGQSLLGSLFSWL